MRICTVVGIRKSGKTTTVTGLVGELKSRGYRVGTVKTVFCPEFTLDTQGSNSSRHKEAGADIVCIKGKKEMDIILPPDADGSFYDKLPVDFLILEGDYELCVPRIICAHKDEEIDERLTEDTKALAGRIADTKKTYQGLRIYHSIHEIKELADLVERMEPAVFPLAKRPMLASAICQCGCHKTLKKQQEKEKDKGADLKAHPKKEGQQHIFLTGEKGVGKSTLLNKLIEALDEPVIGYRTLPYFIEGVRKGYYLHSILPMGEYENDCPVVIRKNDRQMISVPETFEVQGTALLRQVKEHPDRVAVMDEIGKAERKAPEFQKALFSCLDTQRLVLGVLQKNSGEFAEAIAGRPDVQVVQVTVDNRDTLLYNLLSIIKKAG